MFGADTLTKRADSHDRRRKSELTSRLSKNLDLRRKLILFVFIFRSWGVVYSLTTEGHIEVMPFFISVVLLSQNQAIHRSELQEKCKLYLLFHPHLIHPF